MGFGDAVKSGFAKYATFAGRATRSEFWWWWLFSSLVYAVAFLLALILGGSSSSDGVSAVAIIVLRWIMTPSFSLRRHSIVPL